MLRREPVSKSSDVYSYGIIVWETVTQQVPFSDVKFFEMFTKIISGEVSSKLKLKQCPNRVYQEPMSLTHAHLVAYMYIAIKELVDSVCRDGTDTQYMTMHSKSQKWWTYKPLYKCTIRLRVFS